MSRFSTSLFDRLGIEAALIGDLLEERAGGRSAFWYWREVLAAVASHAAHSLYRHKLLALRAMATGFAANYVIWSLLSKLLQPLPPWKPYSSLWWAASFTYILLTETLTGWIVARTHREAPVPMVCAFALFMTLWLFATGFDFTYARMLVIDSLDQPRFRPYLAGFLFRFLAPLLVIVVSLVLGGVLGARPRAAKPLPR